MPSHGPHTDDLLSFLFSAMKFTIGLFWRFCNSLREFNSPQFLAGLAWCSCCAWLNCLSQVYVDKMHWAHFKEGQNKPLPDIGFALLPRINVSHLPDVWNELLVIGTLLPLILFHPSKVKIMRRFAAVQGTCFLLRSVTIVATILPNPYDTCVNTSREDEVPFVEAFKVMLGMRFTCGDVLYSGHAANFTLMALIWQEYGRRYFEDPEKAKRSSLPLQYVGSSVIEEETPQYPKYTREWYTSHFFPRLFWAIAVVGYFIIIACRFHYTVDVVVGIVVVAKQWGLYHMVIRTPKLLERVPLLQWYESKGAYMEKQSSDLWEDQSVVSDFGGFEETPAVTPRKPFVKVVMGAPVLELTEAGVGTGAAE